MKLLRYLIVALTIIITGCSATQGVRNSSYLNQQQKDVWERIRKGFNMPDLKGDAKVDYWVKYYASRPKSVQTMAERSSRYIYYITKELEKRRLPSELALLPFVESAYNVDAFSRSKAAGLWQFIPSTGRHYNLAQDWWKDNRQDITHSTRAALDYLSYLYQFQGNDWHLALASYNWGEGAVRRARDKNEAKGLSTDYLSLSMPNETRNYVPKLMAIKKIIAQPEKYGVKLPNIPDVPYFVEVKKENNIDVKTVARLAGISREEFHLLNPDNKRPVLLTEHQPTILLPQKNVEQYKDNLRNYRGRLASYKGYKPTKGESLKKIADRYGISVAQLKTLNGYSKKHKVALSSRTLMVPNKEGIPAPIPDKPSLSSPEKIALAINTDSAKTAPSIRQVSYAPKPTQSANMLNTPTGVDIAQDDLLGKMLTSSGEVAFAAPQEKAKMGVHPRVASYQPITSQAKVSTSSVTKYMQRKTPNVHVVNAGDTLYSLAKRYGTTVNSIRALNNLGKRSIRKGEHLRMPGSKARG